MFYATSLEKLGLFSILLKSCEKISLGQDSFDNSDIEELSDPYLFLQPQNYSKKENLPADFLSQFNSLLKIIGRKNLNQVKEMIYYSLMMSDYVELK
jgi:hypothetical protein